MAPADGLGRARRADPDEARLPPRFGDLETLQVTKVPDLAGPIAGSGCGLVTKPTSRQMTAAGWPTPAKPWTVDPERARRKPHRRPGVRYVPCATQPVARKGKRFLRPGGGSDGELSDRRGDGHGEWSVFLEPGPATMTSRWFRLREPTRLVFWILAVVLVIVIAGRMGRGPAASRLHATTARHHRSTVPPTSEPTVPPNAVSTVAPGAKVPVTPGTNEVTSKTSTTLQGLAGEFSKGDCVDFDPRDPSAHGSKVGCGQLHVFEVTGTHHMPDGVGAPYPSAASSQSLDLSGACHSLAVAYLEALGRHLDPFGEFSAAHRQPNDVDWVLGNRTVLCFLESRLGLDGFPTKTAGRVSEQDQSYIVSPGTCYARGTDKSRQPVDCSQPHSYEATDMVDLTGRFSSMPTAGQWAEVGATECRTRGAAYLGHVVTGDLATEVLLQLRQESWDAGSRRVSCDVYVPGRNANPVLVTGSLKGH